MCLGLKSLEQVLKFSFQFLGHAETNDKDKRDGLSDSVLNKELDLSTSDLASANGVNCALWRWTTESAVQCWEMIMHIPLQ